MAEKLAIHGGPKAVTIPATENWQRETEKEKALVCKLIDEGCLSASGKGSGFPEEFENEFRKFIGCKYVAFLNHGSSALAAAFYAAGVGPGDEVIVPTAGYIGSYCGALWLGATPVFCEIDPETILADPKDIERRITKRTRAICPIHWTGLVCDMDNLLRIANTHKITLIEDAAHAHGSMWGDKKIGNVGHVACFSMQGSAPGGKPVSAGEGGIFCTNDRELFERHLIYCHLHRGGIVDELKNGPYKHLDSEVLGYKWRAHPLALAIGKVGFDSLPYRNKRRVANRKKLRKGLEKVPGIKVVKDYPKAKPAGFYGGLILRYYPEELGGLPAQKYVAACRAEGIPVNGPRLSHMEHLRHIYTHGFDLYGRRRGQLLKPLTKPGDYPISEDLNRKVLHFPAYIDPPDGLLDQIVAGFGKVSENHGELMKVP
ncbi:MAG: aminotransferase class I/II-fold pyridoxal phosphate-dependent enzyme [Planctomycetota bacterium]